MCFIISPLHRLTGYFIVSEIVNAVVTSVYVIIGVIVGVVVLVIIITIVVICVCCRRQRSQAGTVYRGAQPATVTTTTAGWHFIWKNIFKITNFKNVFRLLIIIFN